MGCYIEPPDGDKLDWLIKNGDMVRGQWDTFTRCPDDKLPVVLLDNGNFLAAGIAYCKEEYDVFTDPDDFRPKKYFLVDKEKLLKVSDLKKYFNKGHQRL